MATLNDIKTCLQGREVVAMEELAQHLQMDPATVRDRLSHWMRKGKVKMIKISGSCQSGCSGCPTGSRDEAYTWISDAEKRP
ncbi:MAG: hypothetical protein HQL98_00545 [Magnetococcales bacterium]|nr:hypothetical protein [Magnetococcales bacterium]